MEEFRPNTFLHKLLDGSADPRYRLVCWAFVLASASHLWLLDAWQPEWLPANLIYVAGLLLLVSTRSAVAWVLCAVGLLIPLLFLRDQLTQSVLLLLVSLSGMGAMLWTGFGGRRDSAPVDAFLSACRGITVATYSLAVLHKLNRDFLDPQYSCAVYGVDELIVYFNVSPDAIMPEIAGFLPWLVLAADAAIPLAYAFRLRRVAWLVSVAFHIPLTLVMAPAFAFVMAVGHVAFATAEDRRRIREAFLRHWKWLVPASTLITAGSLLLHDAWPEVTMIPREWMLWGLLLLLPVAFPPGRGLFERGSRLFANLPRGAKVAVSVVVAFLMLNGLTPYLGVQFQHAGAMLSNLRIDRGCWNSYVFPESVRLTDDYVRIEEAYLHRPGFIEEYENILLDQLWSPPQMLQMRRNWCGPRTRPIYVRGTFRGREFVIEDLCTDAPLPFPDDGIFGVSIFDDFLRYQKNLMRECPQACIH